MMKRTVFSFSLLFFVVLANAQTVEPRYGFTFDRTTVTITGTDLVSREYRCDSLCSGAPECPVTVLFGDEPGDVEIATPGSIKVFAPPQNRSSVDITIREPGRPDRVLEDAFGYASNAITTRADYLGYLVPLTTSVPGAHGSLWEVEPLVHSAAADDFVIAGTACPPLVDPCYGGVVAWPGEVERLYFLEAGRPGEGAFIYVPRAVTGNVTMNLRVRDTGASATNFGTEFPIVRTSEFRTNVHLLDVPTDARYRAMLRIYGGGEAPMRAHVRVYGASGLIEERIVDLAGIVTIVLNPFPASPAYAQLDPLTDAVRASGERVRIEVASESEAKLWAFVSLTNNATQQVTALTPQKRGF